MNRTHSTSFLPGRLALAAAAVALLAAACTTNVEVATEDNAQTVERTPLAEATPTLQEATIPEEPTAAPEPTPTPRVPGVLTVNDTDAVGVVGDGVLSLVEAVRLANGLLTKAELSTDESALVTGDPGAEVADTINVEVGLGGEILLPGADAWIVELFGNDGDTLNGGGAVMTGAVQGDGISHNAMLIGSANVTVRQFSFTDVTAAIGIESASRELDGITIESNAFNNVAIRDITMQNSVDGGVLSNVTIANNSFDAPERRTDFHEFIAVRAASGLESQATRGTSIVGLSISQNSFSAGLDTTRTCISVAAGYVPFGVQSEVVDGLVDDMRISDNTISGCGTAIALTGGLLNQTNGVAINNSISNVTLSGNTITVAKVGLGLSGAFVEPVPEAFQFSTPVDAQLSGNGVTEVDLDTNVWSAIGVVVRMIGAEFAVPGTGGADANSVGPVVATQIIADDFDQFCEEAADVGPLAVENSLSVACADLETP